MKPTPDLTATIGQRVDAIDTPALVVDLDAMERNIERMADFARKHQVRWRPHAKMHKSAELALQMQRAGAQGVCVQKVSEAEALAAGGVLDITITNEIVALPKLERVARLAAQLAARGGRLAIAVDHPEGIARVAAAMAQHGSDAGLDVLVEIDVGQERCGVKPGQDVVTLALEIRKHPELRFAGLQAYQGTAQHLRSAQERRQAIASAVKAVGIARQLIEVQGMKPGLVTGAGTGSLVMEAASGVYGEVQAGSFLFMDADYAQNERDPAQPQFEQALFIKTQVISTHPTHAVCDAGHKSHAIDSGLPKVLAFDEKSGLDYFNGGDEHGILRPSAGSTRLPSLGKMLWLIPGHCDPTVNLHNVMIGVKGGLRTGVVHAIYPVDARGALT